MDKHSKIKLMRRRKKLFPWLRTFCGKYSEQFFNVENAKVFEYLFLNVDEEMKNIYLELNNEKAEDFFNILNSLFLHFWWQIRWKSCKKWKTYWKKAKSPEIASSNDSHRKCCTQLLYYMILLSILLTDGDEKSNWIDRIVTAIKSLPDAVDILYSALLLINDLKKKHKPIYNILLKHTLCCETVVNATEPQTYCKVILLFRRLLMLSKNKKEKSQALIFTSKLKVPSDIQLWFSSQNIEGSNDLNCDNLTQELLSRSYPDELLRKLSEILIERNFFKEKCLIMNTVDADNILSNDASKENILSDFSDASEPDEDSLDSLIKTGIQNNLSDIMANTPFTTENTSNEINCIVKEKEVPSIVSNQVEEVNRETRVNCCSESLEKTLKKRKYENEESGRSSNKKKKKSLKEKKSKENRVKAVAEMNEKLETCSQLSGAEESNKSEKTAENKVETTKLKPKSHKNKKKSKEKSEKKAEKINNELETDLHKTSHKKSKKKKLKEKPGETAPNKIEYESYPISNIAVSNEKSHGSEQVLKKKMETFQEQQDCSLKAKRKKAKSKSKEKNPTLSKKSKKHSKGEKTTTNESTVDFLDPNTILMAKNFLESENHDEYMDMNVESETFLSNLPSSGIELSTELEKPLDEEVETSYEPQDYGLETNQGGTKSENEEKEQKLSKKSKKHSKDKKSTKDEKITALSYQDSIELQYCNLEAKRKKAKSKDREKKPTHSKKSKKHSKEKKSSKSEKTADFVDHDTILMVKNFLESENNDECIDINNESVTFSQTNVTSSGIELSRVSEKPLNKEVERSYGPLDYGFETNKEETKSENEEKQQKLSKKSKKHSKDKKSTKSEKITAPDYQDTIELQNCNLEAKRKKAKSKDREKKPAHSKKSKKHSKEKKSSKREKTADFVDHDTILMVENFLESENNDECMDINNKSETFSQTNVTSSGIELSPVSEKPLNKEVERSYEPLDYGFKTNKEETKSENEEKQQKLSKKSKKHSKEKKSTKSEKITAPDYQDTIELQNCNLEAKRKKAKSEEREKKPTHSKKSKKHSKEKKSSKSEKTADFVDHDTILMVENYQDTISEVENSSEYTENLPQRKKSKKHSKYKPKNSLKCKRTASMCNPDTILPVENFSESENHLSDTEHQDKKKRLKKSSADKLKKSVKHKESADSDSPDTVLQAENFSESKNLLHQTGKNPLVKPINESGEEKLKGKAESKKASEENISEGDDSVSLLEEENEPKTPPKMKRKKLFNSELYHQTKSQKEFPPNKTITSNCTLSKKFSTLGKNLTSSNSNLTNSNINSNLSFEETTLFSDVSISELLKLPKISVYRNNATLGIEDKYTSKIKTMRKQNSKYLKSASTDHNVMPNEINLKDSEQESELSSLKNDLLMASKKILKQSSEPSSSPGLFEKESNTENNDSESTETLSFHSTNKKSVHINSDFINGTQVTDKSESNSFMITKHNRVQSPAVFLQSQFENNTEDTFLSMNYSPEQKTEVTIQRSSECSLDSFTHSSLSPSVVLKDVLRSKSAQKYLSASETSFTSISESCGATRSSTPCAIATNLEMNVSQELTVENIAKVNELYGKNESELINYLCADNKDNLPCTKNEMTIPVDDNLNHNTEFSELQSPSLIQTADNNDLLNAFPSELMNSVPQAIFHEPDMRNQTCDVGTQYFNVENEHINCSSVGTSTEIIPTNDSAVNCTINNNCNKNSNSVSSVQVIINFAGNNDCSTSKKQLVTNFNFQPVSNSSRPSTTSPLFLRSVNSSCNLDNIHNPNLNINPNYHPFRILPINQANSIAKCTNCNKCSSIFCKPEEIEQCVDKYSTQNFFTSTPIVNNSDNRAECNSKNSRALINYKEMKQCVETYDKVSTQNLFTTSSPNVVNNYHNRTECNPQLSLNSVALNNEKNNCNASTQNLFTTSCPNVVNNSYSRIECNPQLSLNSLTLNNEKTFFNNSFPQDSNSFLTRNKAQIPQEEKCEHITENLEFLNKESNKQPLEAEVTNNSSSYRTSTIYSDGSENEDSDSTMTSFSVTHTEFSIGENLEIGTPEITNCKRNKFQVDSEPESFVETELTESPVIRKLERDKKDNAKSQACLEENSNSKFKNGKTPQKIEAPTNHRYNLRNRKFHLKPKTLDDFT